MLDHCLLHKSFVLTVVPVPPQLRLVDTTYPRTKKKFSGQRWFLALQVSGAEFGDDRSMADYISGSRAATNMGVGLTCRQTQGLKHIMG